ncbi:MAG TPA: kynureninase [Alphaproteobacteria bacterium]
MTETPGPARNKLTRDDCVARDRDDPLAKFRDRFHLPEGVIYLDGNSLGALPRVAAERMRAVVEQEWGRDLIRSWNIHGWIDLPRRAGNKIARLIGAEPGEVIVADSTSVNLFKLLAAALRLRPGRTVIVSERDNFPTDLYVAQGLIDLLGAGHELRLIDRPEDAIDAIDEDVAVVSLTHVNYRTGRIHPMRDLTAAAHRAGALMLWDLCHSAGALPVELGACEADLAVGCGYKYLNGGPGAPAFLYVAERLQDDIRPPLSGWMGHAAPFAFDVDYRPAPGIARNLCGTPAILSLTALDAGLDVLLDADMNEVRAKSLALGDLFLDLVAQECGDYGFRVVSAPRAVRGSQVALAHEHGYAIMQALIERSVIGDFRMPDILRFGLTPLYVRYADIWDAVAVLREVMASGVWDQPKYHKRAAVT